MEDTLQRLLDAELQAETLVTEALDEREKITREALKEARLAEERLEARIPGDSRVLHGKGPATGGAKPCGDGAEVRGAFRAASRHGRGSP